MEQHIRLMDIDLEHLAAYEYLCANYAADLRRFYREGLVSTLGCDFKCLDPALFYQLHHVSCCRLTYGVQFRLRFYGLTDRIDSKNLCRLLYDRIWVCIFF